MSKRTKILLLIVISAVGIASGALMFLALNDLLPDWVAVELTLLSNLFETMVDGVSTGLSRLFKAAVDALAVPILILLSPLGIGIPNELAAGLSAGFIAVIIAFFMRSSFTKIAFRNVPRRKLRNGLTVLAIILGVSLVVGVNISFDSAFAEFKHTVNQAAGNVDVNIRSALDEPFDQNLVTTIHQVEGVADASGRISGQAVILKSDGDWKAATVIGVNTSSDFSYLDPSIRITRKLGFVELPVQLDVNGTDIVVDEGLNHTIGDVIAVYVITDINLIEQTNQTGQLDPTKLFFFNVVGVYHPEQIGTEQEGRHTIYIDLVKAQQIFDREGNIDYVLAKVTDIDQTDQVVNRLEDQLGSTYVITSVKQKILVEMGDAFSGFQSGLQIMSALALCVAVVIILNTIYMNVGERTFEIGILRSVGSSTRQVFWIFFAESLTLGFLGVMIGLIVGIPMAKVFTTLSSQLSMTLMPAVTTFVVTPWHLTLGVITGLISTVAGGMFPSILACRMDVVKALRPAVREAGKPRTALKLIAAGAPLILIGFVMYLRFASERLGSGALTSVFSVALVVPPLMAGLIFLAAGSLRVLSPVVERILVPFGRVRKIISRNIERNLLRSTISFTLIGMTLSFIVVMAGAQAGVVGGMEDVIYSFYSADLTVTSQTLLPRSFLDNLTSIHENTLIAKATPALMVPKKLLLENNASTPERRSTCMVLSIDPTTYDSVMSMKFNDETPGDVFAKLEVPGAIILTSPLAESLNVSVNSRVRMQTISEDEPTATWVDFTVIGVAVGTILEWEHGLYSSPLSEACYISYNSLNIFLPKYEDLTNLFFLQTKSGQNIDLVKHLITEEYGSVHHLGLITVNDALAPATAGINKTFTILNAVVLFAVVNAAIGVAAIMVMNVTERRREIGIMRSQGMSGSQVLVSIIGEATVLAAVGFVVGTISGLLLHRVTISFMRWSGFPVPYSIPFYAIGHALALAVLASLVSAAYPAYRASKLNIVDALRRLA